MPIDPNKIEWDKPTIKADEIEWDDVTEFPAETTLRNVRAGLPVAETAANFITSAYGVPVSGLMGLVGMAGGAARAAVTGEPILDTSLEVGKNAVESTQDALVYQPQTEGGKQLLDTAMWPLDVYSQGASFVAEPIENMGYPNLAAGVKTGIEGLPALVGGRYALNQAAPGLGKTGGLKVQRGIEKSVRPSIVKKEMHGQYRKYIKNAKTSVEEIVKNKGNLELIDKDGNRVAGKLPETLDEFSQSIEQTKRKIFDEYDSLAKQTDDAGLTVSLDPIVSTLDDIHSSNTLATLSPETLKYAEMRQQQLSGKAFTATEVQEAIKMLNQSEKAYYSDPTPQMKGRAYVDAMLANNLRAALDATVERATGSQYQPLKQKYGALRALEADVTKRAIVDARKNIRGLIDFSDVFSGYHLIQGILSKEPVTIAAGAASKGIAGVTKWINDPNRVVKKMFKEADKRISHKGISNKSKGAITANAIGGQLDEIMQ